MARAMMIRIPHRELEEMSAKRVLVIKSSRIVTGLVAILVTTAMVGGCRGSNVTSNITSDHPKLTFITSNITSNTSTTVTSEPVTVTHYELWWIYEEGKFSLTKDVNIRSGSAPYRRTQPEVGYKYELLSSGGEVLHSFKFEVALELRVYPGPESGHPGSSTFKRKTVDGILEVPYFINGATINLYDPNGTRVLSVD
ncbi:MAG: hypothetical protein AABZ77_03275, partial [Chloroflexota bacterium]